jgi:hypothetical protein
MITKGGSNSSGSWWARHLQKKENARVKMCEMRGFTATTIDDAFRELEAIAKGTNVKNHFYQANINPEPGEHLTPAQWKQAVDTLEERLGLTGQPRFVVEHEKAGRTHRHVIWSRIDAATGLAISDSLNYQKHERTSREMEIKFDLARGKSVLEPNRDEQRPERAPKSWETQRANEGGLNPRALKEELTDLWRASDSGRAFVAAIEERGYLMTRGDSRVFVIVDHFGQEHSLARRLQGVARAGVRAHMADVKRDNLPTVEEGRDVQRAKFMREGVFDREAALTAWRERAPGIDAEISHTRTERDLAQAGASSPEQGRGHTAETRRELGRDAKAVHAAWGTTANGPAFATALRDQGYMLAQVSADDARSSVDAQAKAKSEGRFTSVLREGDLVAVNGFGGVTAINTRTTGDSREAVAVRLGDIDRGYLANVADTASMMKEVSRQAFSARRQAERPYTRIEAVIAQAFEERGWRSMIPPGNRLESEGITLARATVRDIEQLTTDHTAWMKAEGKDWKPPSMSVGDLFAVTRNGAVHRLNPHKFDFGEMTSTLVAEQRAPGTVAAVRAATIEAKVARVKIWEARKTVGAERQRDSDSGLTAPGPSAKTSGAQTTDRSVAKAADAVGRVFEKLADMVADILSLGAMAASGPRDDNPQLDALHQIEARDRESAALDRIAESMRRGDGIRREDLANLTPHHLLNLRDTGDAGLLTMIKMNEEERARERERSYGPER